MRVPALLGICLLLAGLAYAQSAPMPTMGPAEKNFKGGFSPTITPTPLPKGWESANPPMSGPSPWGTPVTPKTPTATPT
jgi:hypothetical protein